MFSTVQTISATSFVPSVIKVSKRGYNHKVEYNIICCIKAIEIFCRDALRASPAECCWMIYSLTGKDSCGVSLFYKDYSPDGESINRKFTRFAGGVQVPVGDGSICPTTPVRRVENTGRR